MDTNKENKIVNEILSLVGLNMEIGNELYTRSLFSEPFCLTAVELYELLMALEEKYSVYFSADQIISNGFNTLNKIIDLIVG